MLNEFLQKRGKFPLLIAFLLVASCCSVNRVWLQRDVRKGTLVYTLWGLMSRDGKEMVNRCMAAGCSSTPRRSDRVSLLKLPSNGVLRHIWEKQVQQTLALWKATNHSFLCSDHFTEDLFRGGVGCYGGLGWREGRLYS